MTTPTCPKCGAELFLTSSGSVFVTCGEYDDSLVDELYCPDCNRIVEAQPEEPELAEVTA